MCVHIWIIFYMCCVCAREREGGEGERKREREREKERERGGGGRERGRESLSIKQSLVVTGQGQKYECCNVNTLRQRGSSVGHLQLLHYPCTCTSAVETQKARKLLCVTPLCIVCAQPWSHLKRCLHATAVRSLQYTKYQVNSVLF